MTSGKFKNAVLMQRLGLPSKLIRHENGTFRKRPSNRRNLKTLTLRVDGKHFENGAFRNRLRHDNHVISLNEFSLRIHQSERSFLFLFLFGVKRDPAVVLALGVSTRALASLTLLKLREKSEGINCRRTSSGVDSYAQYLPIFPVSQSTSCAMHGFLSKMV